MRIAAALVTFIAIIVAALSSCGDRAPGIIVTSDGRMMDNSAENNRAEAVRAIEHDLQQALGQHWRVSAAIPELPTWADDHGDGDWQWPTATVAVTLLGDGLAPLPIGEDEIREGVISYMRPKVDRPRTNLSVTVEQKVDAAAFARSAAAPAVGSAPVTPTGSAERSYTVQTGDTLADISSAFYGTPQHWRRIVDANPGLDPANLAPGTVLKIPPVPAPATP